MLYFWRFCDKHVSPVSKQSSDCYLIILHPINFTVATTHLSSFNTQPFISIGLKEWYSSVLVLNGCFNVSMPPDVTIPAVNEASKLIFGRNRKKSSNLHKIIHPPFTTYLPCKLMLLYGLFFFSNYLHVPVSFTTAWPTHICPQSCCMLIGDAFPFTLVLNVLTVSP